MANVLLVDDDVVFLDSLKQGLESLGHTIFPTTTVQEALSVLQSSDVDITFCDTIMAGGGALSLLHDMQVHFPDLPFVVMTGRPAIASSPLFKDGMQEASEKIQKSSSLFDIDRLIRTLLRKG